jgi:putative hydrolase of the HAD superfamily
MLALILDADDTLWDNNVFYQEVLDAFHQRMVGAGFAPDEVQQAYADVEQSHVPVAGYSPQAFVRCTVLVYQELCQRNGRPPLPAVEAEVEEIGQRVLAYPIHLLEGVAETLPRLHRYCRLLLLTKGDPHVQLDKLERSGLAPYFEAVWVTPEKGPQVLQEMLDRYGLDPRQTWMVGNSPRSDVNPALAVGIGAIYIPYAVPWAFENDPIADPARVLTVQRFSDLLRLFPEPPNLEDKS